jgi:hypothetical protein
MRLVIQAAAAVAAVLLFDAPAWAQQRPDSAADRQQRTLDSLVAVVRSLQARLDSSATASASPQAPSTAAAPRTGAYMNIGFVALTDGGWSSEKDVQALQPGDHDPHVRGFSIPNAEITLDGAVDPYFKGFSNIVYKLDGQGETGVELEEAYLLTTSLPANLQLKVGQFFTEFGRQNPQHPHAWAFVDQPLVMNRMFGAEGLRSQGARLSWLLPLPFFTEAMVSVMNSAGGTTSSFRSDESPEIHGGVAAERPVMSLRDMLIAPRISSSFDLSETQTLLVGASAAFGPNNSGPTARTSIYGVDAYYKWKPAAAQAGFPFVSLQGEAMFRRYDAEERTTNGSDVPLPSETLRDRGGYAQVLYGIKPRIVAGLRGDVVTGNQGAFDSELRADRYRLSPNFTWYPTEFSKIRFQYNYDDRHGIGTDHSLWIQIEFLLGAHAAHKF